MNKDEATATTGTGHDPITINLDWHYQRDKKVLFEVQIERQGQKSRVEALIDLLTLDSNQAGRLNCFLERQHKRQTSLAERIRTVGWVLDVSLAQERPALTKAERDAEVKRLLLITYTPKTDDTAPQAGELISARRALFETIGWDFVVRAGPDHLAFFEASKELPYYQEIGESWVRALETIDFGLPKLPVTTPAEQSQLEAFFLELRYWGDIVTVQSKHASLIGPHLNDQKWRDAISDTIKAALRPNESLPTLDFYLIKGWLHAGLWGLDNKHRALVLQQVYGLQVTADQIRKRIRELKLRDWADYRDVYYDPSNGHPLAPFGYTVFADEKGDKIFKMRIRFQKRP